MACGIIVVDKPAGWTSHDVVAKLRGKFHEKRVGHGGTLDPMATGVLPVFVGRATRAAQFLESADKEYIAGLRLGLTTDTQDISGAVTGSCDADISPEELLSVLPRFTGRQMQTPPMYSAVKIGGKKLYELARKGTEIERTPREIEIFTLEPQGREGEDYILRIGCSKGTYVRTLCSDIGAALGCGGVMSSLRRVRAGAFTIDRATALDDILACDSPQQLLLPIDSVFSALPKYTATPGQDKPLRNGAEFTAPGLTDGDYRVYSHTGEFLLVGRVFMGRMSTVKSFFEVN